MTLFIAFGLGFLIAVNLLLVIGLAAYHFTVTTNASETQKEGNWRKWWAPQSRRPVRNGRYQADAVPVTTRNVTNRNPAR